MASVLSEPYFHDEAAAFETLERIVWPNGPSCPHCGATGRLNRLANQGLARREGHIWFPVGQGFEATESREEKTIPF